MFIQTEQTPNPATLKFLPGRTIMANGTVHFASPEMAASSPLATRLFAVDGVTAVFFGADFVSVTKDDALEWYVLKPSILGALMEHLTAGLPIVDESADASLPETDDDEVVTQIKDLLDTRVRPAVAMDGGDIIFHGFEDGVVYLQMQGACQGCPSSTATLKMGVENLLRHYVPEVARVEAVL
ncbi:MAG: NifU family protein [Defluviicoccus sp.]|nr:NifU family protein [Defluviicoccus sp.]MDE0384135.1 NifU family protein [Defluviicoccus sp.]